MLEFHTDGLAENFSEMQHLSTIRDEDKIITATSEGKLPFVSADDIAAVAFRALTDEVSSNTDHLILGPELLSYDDVSCSPLPYQSDTSITPRLQTS